MKDDKNAADEALDEFTDWLLDELLKGGFCMDSIPCPNCDGEMELIEDERVFRCPECGYSEDASLREPPPTPKDNNDDPDQNEN